MSDRLTDHPLWQGEHLDLPDLDHISCIERAAVYLAVEAMQSESETQDEITRPDVPRGSRSW